MIGHFCGLIKQYWKGMWIECELPYVGEERSMSQDKSGCEGDFLIQGDHFT